MKRTDIKLGGGILVAGALVLAGNAAPQPARRAGRSGSGLRGSGLPTHGRPERPAHRPLRVPDRAREPEQAERADDPAVRRPRAAERRPPAGSGARPPGARRRRGPGPESDYLPPRVHREVITVDHRGLGRSEPSLACPEVERLSGSSMAAPINDRRTRAKLLPAVQACRDRLTGQGVDLAAYNVREIAADAEDLRVALGIERWNVRAHGSGARIAFEILRRHGEHVRAVWLSSPEIPQLDLLTTGILGTAYATKALAAACAVDRLCNEFFPKVERALDRNLEAAERRPRKPFADGTEAGDSDRARRRHDSPRPPGGSRVGSGGRAQGRSRATA